MSSDWFSQSGYRCRLEWGRQGAKTAAERGDILVVVDTLRFSTAVVTAVHHGGLIYPCLETEDIAAFAQRVGAEVGGSRVETARYSLSPLSFLSLEPGARVALASPNGATCARYGSSVPHLFVGALLNAQAVAEVVSQILESSALCLTVLACGERWTTPTEDGELRIAIEDYLGAGAILAFLRHPKSPEAQVCEGAFRSVQKELEDLLWECSSGRELREKGRGDDVRHAAHLNLYETVPVWRNEHFEKAFPLSTQPSSP